MTRRLLLATAVLIAFFAAANLLQQTRSLAKGDEPVGQTLARRGAGGPGVVIVFQGRDCLGDGSIVRRWNALAGTPGLRVTGLLVDGPAPAGASTSGLSMRVESISAEDAARLAEKLGYTQTPFALVLDQASRVAGSFPGGQNVPPEALSRLVAGS